MSSKYEGTVSINTDCTSDENEKVRRPLLNGSGSPNQNGSVSPQSVTIEEEVKFIDRGSAIKDKYNVIYMVFLLFGIATLLPWNVFITAEDYFVKYKLNTNTSRNATYRTNFTFIVGSLGQFTNVIMNIFNILVTFGGNPKNRIPYTVLLSAACILFHIILAIIDSSTWPLTFFILCCVSVFIMYIATGILNSCVYCVASILPMEYVNAVILGNNLSGCFTAAMSIISKLTSPDFRIAAIYYFLAAFIVLLLSFVGYFVMHRMEYYKYWQKINDEMNKKSAESSSEHRKVPYKKIIKKIWLLLLCIWINFVSTLSIFPVYQLGVKPVSKDFIIGPDWFQDVVTFLTFNILVTLGNLVPKLIRKPGPKWIPIAVFARAIIVFAFFLCSNFKPEERNGFIPVLISNDYIYWLGAGLSPLIFGYFTSLLMMYTPQQVEPENAGTAAMLAALALVIGVVSGLQFTVVLDYIVTSKF